MVGGEVIGITRKRGEPTLLNVADMDRPDETLGIKVREWRKANGIKVQIGIGDTVWWQSDLVMWTPQGAPSTPSQQGWTWDVVLPRVGYSFAT